MYRSILHSYVARAKKQDQTPGIDHGTSSHTNYRFMTTPEKDARMHALQREKRALQLKVNPLMDGSAFWCLKPCPLHWSP